MKKPLIGLASICLVAGAAAACSAAATDPVSLGAGRGASGNGDSGLVNGSGRASGLNLGGASSTGGGVNIDAMTACVADAQTGQQAPLDLYFMVDKSGSMDCRTDASTPDCLAGNDQGTGQSRWDALTDALKQFVAAPADTGIGVGLDFFPKSAGSGATANANCIAQCDPSDCGCIMNCGCQKCECQTFQGYQFCGCMDGGNTACQTQDYAKAAVEIAALPGAASGIDDALGEASPGGDTPTVPALQGALQHANDWSRAHPDRRVAVVLTTDGEPEGCDANNTVDSAMKAAASAAAQNPPISTYVIGVGPSLDNLNAIAKSGGTNQAYLVQPGSDTAKRFSEALNSIRSRAISCDYVIPQPKRGELNYGQVNVRVTLGSSGSPSIISQSPSKAECGTAQAWFYDDPSAPKVIKLCPSACDALLATPGSKLEVLMGCRTIVALPK